VAAPNVTLLNSAEVLDALQRGHWAVLHLQPALAGPVAEAVHEFFGDVFASEGAAGGSAWAPLAASTREAKPEGKTILRRTDTLWKSLVVADDENGYTLATDAELIVGSSVVYGIWHQLGTERMPRREIVPDTVPQEYVDTWGSLVADYLEST